MSNYISEGALMIYGKLYQIIYQILNIQQFRIVVYSAAGPLSQPPPAPSILSHLTSSACVSNHHGNRNMRDTEWEEI